MRRSLSVLLVICGSLGWFASPSAAQFDPPGNYYNSATGTGSTLKNQLRSIMSSGHIERSYGDFRFSAAITDRDPNNSSRILTVYDRSSVTNQWNPGGSLPWNREHVWPQSLQPGSASNSSRGNLGDPHSLRPAIPSINSNRGNDPFGLDNTTGNHRTNGSYYFPGDTDKGDIARSLFYSATRYTGLTLVEGQPGSNQMGDLSSLVAYHFLDPPDEFERRRNHAIYSSSLNPSYHTNNRNAYVDRPEYVWSVFVDQSNDSRITIDAFNNANGASSSNVSLGRVLTGAPVPSDQMVTIDKLGNDGTYYEVTTAGAATSTLSGRYNAMRTGGTDSEGFSVGLNTSTSTAGQRSGTVTINNLDVTTGGGAGRGANDGNDVFNVTLDVLDHATPSFMGSGVESSLTLDFGQVEQGTPVSELGFSLFNLESTLSFTAGLELDSISSTGDTAILTTDLTTFGEVNALEAGQSSDFTASIDTSSEGLFGATYTLNFSDEDLPGGMSLGSLSLELVGEVVAVAENADFNESGLVDALDLLTWQAGFGSGDSLANGDANSDQSVNGDDLAIWQTQYGTDPSAPASVQQVPEPSSLGVALIALLSTMSLRRK